MIECNLCFPSRESDWVIYFHAPILHSITRFAQYIVTSSRARGSPVPVPKNVRRMFRRNRIPYITGLIGQTRNEWQNEKWVTKIYTIIVRKNNNKKGFLTFQKGWTKKRVFIYLNKITMQPLRKVAPKYKYKLNYLFGSTFSKGGI